MLHSYARSGLPERIAPEGHIICHCNRISFHVGGITRGSIMTAHICVHAADPRARLGCSMQSCHDNKTCRGWGGRASTLTLALCHRLLDSSITIERFFPQSCANVAAVAAAAGDVSAALAEKPLRRRYCMRHQSQRSSQMNLSPEFYLSR